MDKKFELKDYDDMSYDEVHALLVEVMQEACAADEAGPYESPSIDLSFLDEEPVSDTEKKPRRRFNMSRFNKVAAIIVIALLGINIVMMATDSFDSYGEGGLLHRIYEGARGIFTDEDESEYVESSETGDVYTITDLKQIDDAKNFWDDLCVPKYIPEGYELLKLTINKTVDGDYRARYVFKSDSMKYNISVSYISDDEKKISNNTGTLIKTNNKIINIYWDVIYELYVADIYMEELIVCVYGDINLEQIEKIAMNIK